MKFTQQKNSPDKKQLRDFLQVILGVARQKMKWSNMRLKKGDTVSVRSNVSDPDFGIPIAGWRGRVQGVDSGTVELVWDSQTLQQMGLDLIIRCENDNLNWRIMVLNLTEVEPAESRDTPSDVERVANALLNRALDDPRIHDE